VAHRGAAPYIVAGGTVGPVAKRVSRLTGAGAIQALARAQELEAQGLDVIHLEIGELDLDTPAHVVEAGVAALRDGRTRYGPTVGTAELREAVADYVTETRGTAVSPRHVLVTPGVKGAIYFTIMALIEAGDEVIVPDPGFPAYPTIIRFAGGVPISMPLRAGSGFQPDPDELRSLVSPRTKMIILNSPGNPTGAILTGPHLAAIAEIAQQHDLWIVSDEIYAQLYFTSAPPPSIFALPGLAQRTILMDGFSKAYAMTGWRLGFGIFPEPLLQPITSMMVNTHSCQPLFVQDAGVAALRGPQDSVAGLRDELRWRRDKVVSELNKIPSISCPTPDAAFYAMMDITGLNGPTAAEVTESLLEKGVSLLSGSMLGDYGHGHLRLAYTVARDRLETALGRIRDNFS